MRRPGTALVTIDGVNTRNHFIWGCDTDVSSLEGAFAVCCRWGTCDFRRGGYFGGVIVNVLDGIGFHLVDDLPDLLT